MTPTLRGLDAELSAVPGTVSVWCGPVGSPVAAYERLADARHYAASTMKVAVLAALHRAADAGRLDLDAEVPVVNEFESALAGAPRFRMPVGDDEDDEVWGRLGTAASLRWLARHMIVRSSNLATNVVLAHVGVAAAGEVLRLAGATGSRVRRGIEDGDARRAGIDNEVTARDLAALLGAIVDGRLASPAAGREMTEVLLAQERHEDLAAGLPPGTRVAHKNGWITGVRHSVGVVFPHDAPPYAIAVCTTTPLARSGRGDDACALVARIAAASWADRRLIGR